MFPREGCLLTEMITVSSIEHVLFVWSPSWYEGTAVKYLTGCSTLGSRAVNFDQTYQKMWFVSFFRNDCVFSVTSTNNQTVWLITFVLVCPVSYTLTNYQKFVCVCILEFKSF